MASTTETETPFRVVIVGAGLAGLVASHCLQRAGIDHVVLEKQTDIAPQLGASIAIYPNGARILHQIGCLRALEESCVPLNRWWSRGPDGKAIMNSSFFAFVKENHGQDVLLLERRQLLQTLYDYLPDKNRLRVGCEVKTIKQDKDGVEVILADGTMEKGDIVLGADGVRSPVRSMMWEHANKTTPGLITAEEKRKSMKTSFRVLLGMGPPAAEVGERDLTICSDSGFVLTTVSQPTHLFFCVYQKLEKDLLWPRQPRYTMREMDVFAESVADHPVSDTIVFGELWKKRDRAMLVGLEEGVLQHWYHDRIVLVGDSVHKMLPNIGLGGNMALESVAVLCNHLHAMLVSQQGKKPDLVTLNKAFAAYQEERMPRVLHITDFSTKVAEGQAWVTPFHKFYTKWLIPLLKERALADMIAELMRGAPKLAYVDSSSFGKGTVQWDDEKEDKKETAKRSLQWTMSVATLVGIVAIGTIQYGRVRSLLGLR
ncbi:hypothetical protein DTO212C5_826 [Paecilomyces variotii]|nr:hypothetical protein DTO212C5_826 [Paecilomyces variotii]